jgi:hypothetical protein
MVVEVGSRSLVEFILIAPNAFCLGLALGGIAHKKVGNAALVDLNLHLGFEKYIYRGPPSFLGHCYESQ